MFFHKTATDRRKKNKINALEEEHVRSLHTQEQIEEQVLTFYSDLFNTSSPSNEDISLTTDLISKVVSEDMNRKLNTSFSDEEIKKAAFDLNS